MASFTDKIPTFNPYVSQQPVESMVKVGMMKQQKYDTNLERIYQSMDEVAGLDIIHGSDQAYLKNKMKEVTGNLNTYAAGDFSNNNLTRNVRGLVSSIADDDTIKTAVQSTVRVRSEVAKSEAAEKKGESSVVNQWILNTQIQDYLSNPATGQSFNGEYVPYKDVDKKLMDIYDKLPDEEKIKENIFKRDAVGNTLYFSPDCPGPKCKTTTDVSQGWEPEVDQVMLHQEIKGKSSSKIMKAFMASLDADDLRQLDMNGSYHYRNASPDTFINEARNYGEALKQSYRDNIDNIATELVTNTDLDSKRRESLETAMSSYQKDLDDGVIDDQVRNQISNLNNPTYFEQYKKDIYKGNYLLEKSNSLENISTKQLWKDNPKFNARMKVKEYDLKVKNYQLKEKYQRLNYQLDTKEFKLKQDKYNDEKAAASAAANPTIVDPVPLDNEDQPKNTYESLSDELDTYTAVPGNHDENWNPIEPGLIYKLNEKFAKTAINLNANDQTKQNALEELFQKVYYSPSDLDKIVEANTVNGAVNPKQFREYYKKRLKVEREKTVLSKRYADATEEGVQFDDELDDFIGEHKGIPIGTEYDTLSRSEIDEFNKDKRKYTKEEIYSGPGPGYGGGVGGSFKTKITDYDGLRSDPKYAGTKYEDLIDIMENGPEPGLESTIMRQYNRVTNELAAKKVDVRSRKKEHQDRFVEQHTPKLYGQTMTLLSGIKEEKGYRDNVRRQISNAMTIAESYDGGSKETNSHLDKTNIRNIRTVVDGNKFPIAITKNPDGSAKVTVTGPKATIDINLSPEQVRNIPQLAIENPFNQALQIIRSSKNNSTNGFPGNGKIHPAHAYYSGEDFPSIVNSKISSRVRADIVGSDSNVYSDDEYSDNSFANLDNTFALQVYFDLGGGQWMKFDTSEEYMPLAHVYSDMKRLNPLMINNEVDNYLKKQ